MEMPERQRVCPVCWLQAGSTDMYCSSCGSALPQSDVTSATVHASIDGDIAPLMLTRPVAPPDLQPLTIIPDNRRQRLRMVKRSFAVLVSLAIASIFAITLIVAGAGGAGEGDAATMRTLAIVSGLLTIVALGGWINAVVRRARKRARRQEWQMSVS